MQAEIIARAQSIQDIVNQRHITKKLRVPRQTEEYRQGEYVLWEYPEGFTANDSRPDRLSSHYRGPYRVIKTNSNRVQIQNLITKELHEVLVAHLKPFHYDSNIVDKPLTVARYATSEFLPALILEIDGDKNKKNQTL